MHEALIGYRLFAWQAQDARVREFPQRAGPQIEGAKPGGRPLDISAAGGERDAKGITCGRTSRVSSYRQWGSRQGRPVMSGASSEWR